MCILSAKKKVASICVYSFSQAFVLAMWWIMSVLAMFICHQVNFSSRREYLDALATLTGQREMVLSTLVSAKVSLPRFSTVLDCSNHFADQCFREEGVPLVPLVH